jgi:hypothetical protein
LGLILVVARARPDDSEENPAAEGTAADDGTGLGWLAGGIDPSDDLSIAYTASPTEALMAAEQALAQGRQDVAVVPVVPRSDGAAASVPRAALAELRKLAQETSERHPGASVSLMATAGGAPTSFEDILALIHPADTDDADLLAAAIGRAFDGDTDRFGRFVRALQRGMPPDSQLALRGSAIQGFAYKSGEPFDALGPRTSDLDLVLLGDRAMDAFHPEAFIIPGVNTLPLSDRTIWVAPTLDPARSAAQSIARRPVAIQAMARWFLDLRSGLQAQPYVVLDA